MHIVPPLSLCLSVSVWLFVYLPLILTSFLNFSRQRLMNIHCKKCMSIKGQGHWWKVKAQTCYHDNFLFRQSFMQIFLGFYFSYVYIWNGNWRQWKNVSPGFTFLDIFLDIQWMYIPSNVLEKNIYYIYICQCRKMCIFFSRYDENNL